MTSNRATISSKVRIGSKAMIASKVTIGRSREMLRRPMPGSRATLRLHPRLVGQPILRLVRLGAR